MPWASSPPDLRLGLVVNRASSAEVVTAALQIASQNDLDSIVTSCDRPQRPNDHTGIEGARTWMLTSP